MLDKGWIDTNEISAAGAENVRPDWVASVKAEAGFPRNIEINNS